MQNKRSKNRSGQRIQQKISITTGITVVHTDMTQETRTRQKHSQRRIIETRRMPPEETHRGDHKTTRHTYRRKDEIKLG